jgi:hypothetical protein
LTLGTTHSEWSLFPNFSGFSIAYFGIWNSKSLYKGLFIIIITCLSMGWDINYLLISYFYSYYFCTTAILFYSYLINLYLNSDSSKAYLKGLKAEGFLGRGTLKQPSSCLLYTLIECFYIYESLFEIGSILFVRNFIIVNVWFYLIIY